MRSRLGCRFKCKIMNNGAADEREQMKSNETMRGVQPGTHKSHAIKRLILKTFSLQMIWHSS